MPIKSEQKQESDATIQKVEDDRGLSIQVFPGISVFLATVLFEILGGNRENNESPKEVRSSKSFGRSYVSVAITIHSKSPAD